MGSYINLPWQPMDSGYTYVVTWVNSSTGEETNALGDKVFKMTDREFLLACGICADGY